MIAEEQSQNINDLHFMQIAMQEAELAALEGEVPIGACVVYEGKVIARAHNRRETDKSPSAHAEFLAMQEASAVLDRWRLCGCTVYVTLEPCLMCAGLMINSRVDRCVFASYDPKGGALGTLYSFHEDERLNHEFQVEGGVMEDECSAMLKAFFARRREERKQAKQAGTFQKPQATELTELERARNQINTIDAKMFTLFHQRLDAAEQVAHYKLTHSLEVFDSSREEDKLAWAKAQGPQEREDLNSQFMQDLMDLSKQHQHNITDGR